MFNIRRVYVYVVTAVTLNAVAWAIIALLRNLLTPGLNPISGSITYNREMIALQLAIILIGLPIYLTHWLWAERLSQREAEERQAVVRLLYLYLMLTLFLAPFIANATVLCSQECGCSSIWNGRFRHGVLNCPTRPIWFTQ
jgi:hypothetical protein